MPVKSFTFTFKLDAKDLFAFIAENNVAVDIQALGSRRVEPQEPKAIEHRPKLPKKMAYSVVRDLFEKRPNDVITPKQAAQALKDAGFTGSRCYGLFGDLLAEGVIERIDVAKYKRISG
jgi:hypothetical protein